MADLKEIENLRYMLSEIKRLHETIQSNEEFRAKVSSLIKINEEPKED